MSRSAGLRERKKAEMRERIADVAAGLFAQHGYDAVTMLDVARAAGVSDQTVYNYFPAKQDLVLDRAEEFRLRYGRAVSERPAGTSPAAALRPLVGEDIDRFHAIDPLLSRGELPAQCLHSGSLRRFALEAREQQPATIAAAIVSTTTDLPDIVARAHAAALVSVIQTILDQFGRRVLETDFSSGSVKAMKQAAVDEMHHAADLALDNLDRAFRHTTRRPIAPS